MGKTSARVFVAARRAAVGLLAGLAMANGAHAVSFELADGDLYGSWDTTLSIGAAWRLQNRDQDLIGIANGGNAFSVNGDDGNLNWSRGKTYSRTAKITSELELNYGNWSAFFRGLYFYDFAIEDGDTDRTPISQSAKDLSGSRLDLLDAFIRYQFNLGEMPAEFRVGEQVVNWGESTFIQGGNNVINHFNVAALRVPGAELREALLPQDLVYFSVAPSENTTLEFVYQYDWDDTEPDPVGTFFGSNDFVPDGGSEVRLAFGDTGDFPNPEFSVPGRGFNTIPRLDTVEPDDGGQGGVAFRWFLPDFNNGTEFGFYYYRYHSRLPLISARTATAEGLQQAAFIGASAGFGGAADIAAAAGAAFVASGGDRDVALQAGVDAANAGVPEYAARGIADAAITGQNVTVVATAYATDAFANTPDASGRTAGYFTSFPEDIDMYGISFNTTWGQWAWQGEWSHHRDKPLQVDDLEVLFAGLSALRDPFAQFGQLGSFSFNSASPQFNPDTPPLTNVVGFKRKNTSQFQATATRLFGPVFGASQGVLLWEGALYRVHGFEPQSVLRYNGPATYVSGNADLGDLAHPGKPIEGPDHFASNNSYGYRLAGRLDYPNAVGPINLFPFFSWQHDIKGVSPGPGGAFLEGRKALTVGLRADYLNAWEASLVYTTFHGADRFNLINDRDFMAATLKYTF